jgi:rhamnose transport system permease protein
MSPFFFTLNNQINLFQLSIEKVIVAIIMTLVIINAEIDLSVASIMGFSACLFGFLFQNGLSAEIAIVVVLFGGAILGAFNAFWIAWIGIPSLVVTLATMIAFRGFARGLVEDRGIGNFPDWFDALGQDGIIGALPLSIITFVLLAGLFLCSIATFIIRPASLFYRIQSRCRAVLWFECSPCKGCYFHYVWNNFLSCRVIFCGKAWCS